jgi:flagellar biosynthesis/type III secretory pathway chaperone
MSTALSNTFHAALASKKKAFDAHCKAVAKLRKDTDNEVAQIIARATSLLDQLDEDREAKAKEKRTTIQAIAHRALNEMSESFKSIKGVHKECVNANETSRREFAEEMEKIKAELDLAMKQSLARVAAEKKKVREEPILPRAVIESISAACRQHA